LSIKIFYDETDFRLNCWRRTISVLNKVIGKEGMVSGDLNFIITNDVKLREMNVKFLGHDYNTDVITFNYNSENTVNGEVYISIDTVWENSINYNVSLRSEILRVIIHGVLHLVGYDDKTDEQKRIMRESEDAWLSLIDLKKNGL
jgi:probable rRNA maturation factor